MLLHLAQDIGDDHGHLVAGGAGEQTVETDVQLSEAAVVAQGLLRRRETAVQRRQIHVPTVAGKMVDGTDVGYIRVAVFSEGTADDFTKEFTKLREQGMNKLILDLRDNPGGIVEQAVGVVSNFVPPDSTIVSYTEQDGKVDQYTAQGTEDPSVGVKTYG